MLMAWGGDSLYERTPPVPSAQLDGEKQRSMTEVRQLGVIHRDARLANMLWNDSQKRVMLVDFERSVLQVQKRPRDSSTVLQEGSPNKKQRMRRKSTSQKKTLCSAPVVGTVDAYQKGIESARGRSKTLRRIW